VDGDVSGGAAAVGGDAGEEFVVAVVRETEEAGVVAQVVWVCYSSCYQAAHLSMLPSGIPALS
jgi:hypothetical protein